MPPTMPDEDRITIRMTPEQSEFLDAYSHKYSMNKSDFARFVLFEIFPNGAGTTLQGMLENHCIKAEDALAQINRRLELLYQLHYFLGKKLAADEQQFFEFVKRLKQHILGEEGKS